MPDIDTRLRYARDLGDSFRRREDLARSATSGRLHRVARGAYLPADVWTEADDQKKYLTLIRAVATTREFRPVASHFSAAAIHGLPMVGAWPSTVHTIVGPTTGGRSRNSVVKHSLRLDDSDVVEIGRLFVTSVARTVLDVATLASPLVAVTMADRAVHVDRRGRIPPMTTKAALFDVWERSLPARAHARTKEVFESSTELADSPLESVSRVSMRVIGCPPPRLQSPFSDYRGIMGETDFDWPSFNLIGEADGDIKYLDEPYRGGRSAEQVMRDERVRENRLRALKLEVSRWNWSTAIRRGDILARDGLGACRAAARKGRRSQATRPGCSKCPGVADSSSSILRRCASGRITSRQCIGLNLRVRT